MTGIDLVPAGNPAVIVASFPVTWHTPHLAGFISGAIRMKIAVLGTGRVGGILGGRWAKAGHAVTFGSRDPACQKVRDWLAKLETPLPVTSHVAAARGADVVLLAVPWQCVQEVLAELDDLTGQTIIDCINPLTADFRGLDVGHSTSAAEQIAQWAPGANVVKAFNSVSAATMANPLYGEQRATLFYCGDSPDAKSQVRQLVTELDFEPVDAGPLRIARYIEPLAMLYIHLAVFERWGGNCAFNIVKR